MAVEDGLRQGFSVDAGANTEVDRRGTEIDAEQSFDVLGADRCDQGMMEPGRYGEGPRRGCVFRPFERDLAKDGVDESSDTFATFFRGKLNRIVDDGVGWNALQVQ